MIDPTLLVTGGLAALGTGEVYGYMYRKGGKGAASHRDRAQLLRVAGGGALAVGAGIMLWPRLRGHLPWSGDQQAGGANGQLPSESPVFLPSEPAVETA